MIGTVVGTYRILDLISSGGMGTVYRAQHTLLGRIAAVKVLHPEMSASTDVVNRFFNEARATTAIKHPGIVEIFDFGYMPSGHAYLVMEFLDGMPLARRMQQRGPVPEAEAAFILRGVSSALAAAHLQGIIHRDLKPDNIFVVPDADSPLGERYKLLDFGIAKLTDIGAAASATRTGLLMGTPTYMSPEQCKGAGNVDHRADLYSLGCIFYELLTGRPPFVHDGAGEMIGAHLYVTPDSPVHHAPGLSPAAASLVMTLLEKQPERRVQSARELAGLLAQIAQRYLGTNPALSSPGLAAQPPANFTPLPFAAAQPLAGQHPTTLSSSAGARVGSASTAGPPRRTLLVGAVGLGVLVAVVIALVALGRNQGASGGASAEPAAASAPRPPSPPRPTPPEPAPREVTPSEAVAAPATTPVVAPAPATTPVAPAPAAARSKSDANAAQRPTAAAPPAETRSKPPAKARPGSKTAPDKKPAHKDDLIESDL